jgi:F-type H+-transporting ATPase subunit b
MTALAVLTALNSSGQAEEIARTFGVDWPHLVAQMISFGIVCFLLHRFAYKRVLAMLQDRRKRIEEGLANTEKIKTELAESEAHRQEVLQQANAQAKRLIEEARAAAARVQAEETRKAIAAAEQIVAKSHEAAEQDYGRMLAQLKHDVGHLVVQTTAVVAGKVLTPEDQRRLAEETARQMAA